MTGLMASAASLIALPVRPDADQHHRIRKVNANWHQPQQDARVEWGSAGWRRRREVGRCLGEQPHPL